jgi:hypothetical protein
MRNIAAIVFIVIIIFLVGMIMYCRRQKKKFIKKELEALNQAEEEEV